MEFNPNSQYNFQSPPAAPQSQAISFGGVPGVGGANPASQTPQTQPNGLNPTQQFNGSNWNPTYQQNAGYNPSQYATTETANTLAGALGSGLGLGANVRQTQNAPGSPIGPPPQNMLDFGGADMLNAGLMAERYKKYDQATADQMTRDELAMMGPRQAPNEDSQGGSMGSWSQYGGAPEGGSQNLGGGQNIGQFVGENAGWRPQGPGGAVAAGGQGGQGGQFPGQGQGVGGQFPGLGGQFPGQGQGYGGGYGGGQGHQQSPQFGFNQNYGGFGRASNFQQANQFSPQQQFLQMLMGGGQNGNFQMRGRQPNFNSGLMGNLMGQPSLLSRFNQVSGNGGFGYGPGQGRQSPFASGSMSGMSNFMNGMQQQPNKPFFPGMGGNQWSPQASPTAGTSGQGFFPGMGGGGYSGRNSGFAEWTGGNQGLGQSYFMGGPPGGYDGGGNYLG